MADLVVLEGDDGGGIYINDSLVLEGYNLRDLFIKFLIERAGHTVVRHWIASKDPFWNENPTMPVDLPEEYR